MKLEITILNGARKGSIIHLHEQDNSHHIVSHVLEDEAVSIKLMTTQPYDKVELCLHENIMECNTYNEVNGVWEYSWIPRKISNQFYESFFHNYFGIAEFHLLLISSNEEKLIQLERLDVLARKINAERVDDMLSFLAKHNSDALCAFFRVTRRNAGFKDGDTPADIYLEWIEKTTSAISQLTNEVLLEPITKLTTKYQFISPNETTNVDDQTLSWLCDNLDELFESDNEFSSILEYNGQLYSSRKIRENSLHNDTNVYENQVIHGFITTLKLAVSGLLAGFESAPLPNDKQNISNDYVSFYNQIRKFQRKINEKKVYKCRELLTLLGSIKTKIQRKIPVKRQLTGIPTLTMKVKKNKSYLTLFTKIASWHRFGSPDWSMQEELLSIKSMPKLFEYYTLFYLKEKLDVYFNASAVFTPDSNQITFLYNYGSVMFTLHYEPKYWMPLSNNAGESLLINAEDWTVYNGNVSKRAHHTKNSNRSPDFVITASKDNINNHYILDAKYTNDKKAFTHYLPELTLKYMHGLQGNNDSKNEILGLTIITPHDHAILRHFHSDDYNLFAEKPVFPALNVASVKPGEEFKENIIFEKVIARVLDLMLDKYTLDNVYEINAKSA